MSCYESLLSIIQNHLFDKRLWLTLFLFSGFLIFAPDSLKSFIFDISLLPTDVAFWVGMIFLFACSYLLSFFLLWIINHIPPKRYKHKKEGGVLWYFDKYSNELEFEPRCIKHHCRLHTYHYDRGYKAFYCPKCPKRKLIIFTKNEYDMILEKVIDYFNK